MFEILKVLKILKVLEIFSRNGLQISTAEKSQDTLRIESTSGLIIDFKASGRVVYLGQFAEEAEALLGDIGNKEYFGNKNFMIYSETLAPTI